MDIGNPSARSPAYVAAHSTLVETSGTSVDPRTREAAGRQLADSVVRTAKVEPVDDEPREQQQSNTNQGPPAPPAKSPLVTRVKELFGSLKEFPADLQITLTMRELAARALRIVTGGPEIPEREEVREEPTDAELDEMLAESEHHDGHTSFLGTLRDLTLEETPERHPDSGFLLDVTG